MNQRLAVAIEEIGAEEKVAEHFGRCSKFYVCELDEQKKVLNKETFFNPLAGEHSGACQLPAYVKQFNVNNYCRRNGTKSCIQLSSVWH